MDIRQIQALHAQYSAQPVVIDISGHAAAMPALQAPEGKFSREFGSPRFPAKPKLAARPALVCVAIAAVAAGGGISAAKLWRVLQDKPAAVHMTGQPVAAMIPAITSGAPINVAPASPLTPSDFNQQPVTASPLASVDPRSLSGNVPRPSPVAEKSVDTAAENPLARAAASSIHAHGPASGQWAAAPAITPPPSQPVVTTPSPVPTTPHAPVDTPQTSAAPAALVHTASADEAQTAKPALRPIRRVIAHRAVTPAPESSAPAVATQAAPSKAPAAKGGDVQLF